MRLVIDERGRWEPGYTGPWFRFWYTDGRRPSAYDYDCKRCMKGLGAQLEGGAGMVELDDALRCTKVVVAGPDTRHYDNCLGIVHSCVDGASSDQRSPALIDGIPLNGKFGGGLPGLDDRAVILYTTLEEAEDARRRLGEAAGDFWPDAEVRVVNGCANLHGLVLGDPGNWRKRTMVAEPGNTGIVMERLRVILRHRGIYTFE